MNLKEKKDRGRAIYCKLWGEKEEPKENTLSYAQRMGYKNEREYQEAYKRSGIAEIARAKYKEYQAYCKSLDENITSPHEAEEKEADSIADKVMRKAKPDNSGNSPISQIKEKFNDLYDNPDLDNVKIHTNDKAAESAEALNARAFTQGKDIYFNKGEFKPGTEDGDRLIAHEMAHVVQGGEGVRRKEKLGSLSWEDKHYKFQHDWLKSTYEFYGYSYEEWLIFLQNARTTEKSMALNIFMAAAIGEPEKAISGETKSEYRDIKYEGPEPALLKNSARELMRALLLAKKMRLPWYRKIFGGGTTGMGHDAAVKSLGPLFKDFSRVFMYDVMKEIEAEGKGSDLLNEKISKQIPVVGSSEIVNSTSLIAIDLIKSIADIKISERGKWLSTCNRIELLGKTAGRAIKELANIENRKVDKIGDAISIVLGFLPGDKIVHKLFYAIGGLFADDWGDKQVPVEDTKLANKTKLNMGNLLEDYLKKIDSLNRSQAEIEAIYARVYSGIRSFKQGLADGRLM